MTVEEKLAIVREWTGTMTEREEEEAREMLESSPSSSFGGSYSPVFTARWIMMNRQARKIA